MSNYDWPVTFRRVFHNAVTRYRSGANQPATLFPADDIEFLAEIGCSTQELFDFVEDHARCGEPDYEMVLLITAVRRDYFLAIQHGRRSEKLLDMDSLPAKTDVLDGLPWLPRIIEKAQAKLRGEMPPELMYGCGGDRPFLRGVNVHPADFLRVVWAAGSDKNKVVAHIRNQSGAR